MVLLDLHLPDGNGMDLLAELTGKGTAVIVMTAYGEVSDAVNAIKQGAEFGIGVGAVVLVVIQTTFFGALRLHTTTHARIDEDAVLRPIVRIEHRSVRYHIGTYPGTGAVVTELAQIAVELGLGEEMRRALLQLPQENLLYFLEKSAPRLLPWQREVLRDAVNEDAEVHLFGQEVNPETWAVSKADLFM